MAGNIRYQIFVSSTYNDLFPVRRKVTEHILSMNHIPAGMEMFSASGRQQWKTIQKAIDNSDYYVLIIGERYGSISEDEGISYTEKEFDYARSRNIPTLCFIPGKNFTTTRENRELDHSKLELLEKFKGKVLNDQLCDFWSTEDELVSKISASLYKIFTEEPGVGWVRGNVGDPEALSKLVRLMEENNHLRDELQKIEEQNSQKKPELSLRINDHDFSKGELLLNIPETKHELFAKEGTPLSMLDVPFHLKGLVDNTSIKEYNDNLPTSGDIQAYNEKLRLYYYAKKLLLSFSLNNTSSMKANNVSIRVVLPEGILALDSEGVRGLNPLKLPYPVNPIEAAENKFGSSNLDFLLGIKKSDDFGSSGGFGDSLIGSLRPYDIHIKEPSILSGRTNYVRQKTTESLDSDIHLFALISGSYTLKVSLLCDEFEEWHTSELQLTFV